MKLGVAERTDTERAYAAGIIDGEGTMAINRTTRSDNAQRTYALQVRVSSVTPCITDYLRSRWGGTVSVAEPGGVRQTVYSWQTASLQAGRFLQEIQPYLVLKRDQSVLCRAFQALSSMAPKGFKRIPALDATKERIYWKMRDLKQAHRHVV